MGRPTKKAVAAATRDDGHLLICRPAEHTSGVQTLDAHVNQPGETSGFEDLQICAISIGLSVVRSGGSVVERPARSWWLTEARPHGQG